jgi:hypothetical protein
MLSACRNAFSVRFESVLTCRPTACCDLQAGFLTDWFSGWWIDVRAGGLHSWWAAWIAGRPVTITRFLHIDTVTLWSIPLHPPQPPLALRPATTKHSAFPVWQELCGNMDNTNWGLGKGWDCVGGLDLIVNHSKCKRSTWVDMLICTRAM